MKKNEVIKTLLFIVLVISVWTGLSGLLRYKESSFYKDMFYKRPGDYDVLFFGASYPHNAFNPEVLYNEYGISSYNLSMSGEPMALTLYSVKSAIEKKRPSVIVVDCGKISDDPGESHIKRGESHKTLDALPLSKTKAEAVYYLFRNGIISDPLEFLSSMWAYHDRISSLLRYDYEVPSSWRHGWNASYSIVKTEPPVPDPGKKEPLKDGEGVKAYKEIVRLCKENDISLILTALPWSKGKYESIEGLYNSLADYTEGEGFRAINLNAKAVDAGLDYDHDFSSGGHLNAMGAEKISLYMGKLLSSEYKLSDRRNGEIKAFSEESGRKGADEIRQYLSYQDNAIPFLFASKDKNLKTEVVTVNDSPVFNIYGFREILKYSGADVKEDPSLKSGSGYDALINIYDKDGKLLLSKSFILDPEKLILTTTGEEAERVNYFP